MKHSWVLVSTAALSLWTVACSDTTSADGAAKAGDTAQSDLVEPDTAAEDLVQPDAAAEDLAEPDTAAEDLGEPDTSAEDATSEDAAVEDTTAEDIEAPDTTPEDTTVEDATAEDMEEPDTAPEDTAAEDTTPEDTWVEPDVLPACDPSEAAAQGTPCVPCVCDGDGIVCGPAENGTPCGGELCTGLAQCVDGTCQSGLPTSCDDDDVCTVDTCGAEGCVNTPLYPAAAAPCVTRAATFDGASCVTLEPIPELGATDFTVEVWLRPSVNALGPTNGGSNVLSLLDNSNFTLSWVLYGPNTFPPAISYTEVKASGVGGHGIYTPPVLAGTWVHVALVREVAGGMRLYVNGELVKGIPGPWDDWKSDISSTLPLSIGCRLVDPKLPKLVGDIDSFRVSLGSRYGLAPFCPPTQAQAADADTLVLLNFDEEPGPTVLDQSGNGHHGTWSGTAASTDAGVVYAPCAAP